MPRTTRPRLNSPLRIRLPDTVQAHLEDLAKARHLNVSEVVRLLIEQALALEGDADDLPVLLRELHR